VGFAVAYRWSMARGEWRFLSFQGKYFQS
jgi:hypothetical protein